MNTKNILLTTMFAVFILSASAQLKVDQYGRIGMGTLWPNPSYKCHVAGNLLCTSYPANPYYELQLKVGNGWPGCEIGATSDILAFWSSYINYHELRASNFIKMSDSTTKSNILPIENGLERILKLRAVSYSTEDNKIDGSTGNEIAKEKTEFGFLSQQVRDLFPEANITVEDQNDFILLDYDQIIPIAVASIQEQQKIIDSLKTEITNLKDVISDNLNKNGTVGKEDIINIKETVLYQNRPNPFNEKTIIEYEIEDNDFSSASIIIFDMNGTLLKSFPINSTGKNQLTINGNELKAGMYIYSLIVNDKEVDTKRMILLK